MNVLIVGGNGGIGRALIEHLLADERVERLDATWRASTPPKIDDPRVHWHQVDPGLESSVAELAAGLPPLHRVIVAGGLLHDAKHGPEKAIRRFDPDFFLDSLRANTLPALLLAKHLEPKLRHDQHSAFAVLSARVGSIGENHRGGWYSYRSSKAALNMALKTLAIEWRLRLPHCSVAALHPGTVDTALSAPFQSRVPEGKLFTPEYAAGKLLAVVDQLGPENSGQFWSWDGTELPW